MAVCEKNPTIVHMVQSLIFLLRKTISNSNEFITIREELEILEKYIEIQKIRYYDSFDYETIVDPNVADALIPKLILQPLVENALFHGIHGCDRRGLIKVSVQREEDDCVIVIHDNGSGINMDRLQAQLIDTNAESFSGIGVNSVNERIKLNYGEKYGLSFSSTKESHTDVTVRFAYQKAGDMN